MTEEQYEHEMYKVEEVAEILRVHVTTVRRWINLQKIDAVRLPGGGYRITAKELARIRTPRFFGPN